MKNYFSVLKWVRNLDYNPDEGEIENALVQLEDEWGQDFKIGERVLPGLILLWKLHTACVKLIQRGDYFLENYRCEYSDRDGLNLRMKDVFDFYEIVENTTYMSWMLSNNPEWPIAEYIDNDGEETQRYKEYKSKNINSVLTEAQQKNNLSFFLKECNILARIEVVDIIYDFINQRKIYVLDMKPFKY